MQLEEKGRLIILWEKRSGNLYRIVLGWQRKMMQQNTKSAWLDRVYMISGIVIIPIQNII